MTSSPVCSVASSVTEGAALGLSSPFSAVCGRWSARAAAKPVERCVCPSASYVDSGVDWVNRWMN
jgi:hypothetical protein